MTTRRFIIGLAAIVLMAGCANRGVGPQGGPRDSVPPIPLYADPEIGALNFHGDRIEVTFNEYIQLDNVATNMLMSPPQQNTPEVKARGKKLIVQLKDTLHDSTTYTIDFGSSVCDYREKVPLRGFSFFFSTGPEIDTLEHIGHVYEAETLNPVYGMLVGIHKNMDDTAFVRNPFLRIAKTDSAGLFRIGNIHPGRYRLYAVDDISRDYRLTIGEALAFADRPIEVTAPVEPVDTSAVDTAAIVTVLPSNMSCLFLFQEAQKKLYLQRVLRDEQHKISVLFSSSPDSLMTWRVLRPSEVDSSFSDSTWIDPSEYIHPAYSAHGDTVVFWLTDSTAIGQDSIFLETRYRRTDSIYHLEWYTDTLRAIWRAPKLNAKALEAKQRELRNRRLELKTNARKGFEMYDTLWLSCTTPLAVVNKEAFHLYERVDTILTPVPFEIAPYDTLPLRLTILADLQPNGEYELQLDSAALYDAYGFTHIAAHYALKVKTPADYSTLRVILKPFEPKARIQLLNSKDVVVRELPATEEGAFFEHLKPDTYYMRLYLDEDGDGRWTTGSWEHHRQPEPVYYYHDKIQTKSNWDFEQEWDYTSVEQVKSKPHELVKVVTKKK